VKPKPAPAPAPAPKPAPKPVEKPTQKVEELGITLDDAITSINTLAQGQTPSSQSVNDRTRAALVNIICTSDASGPFESISGSGVVIDPRGVILTNAHVAQFFLLKDYPVPNFVDCTIRTGSPAYPRYKAELIFLPPTWIRDNSRKITDEAPRGTGERDYAFLRITGAVNPSVTLPPTFPYLLLSTAPPNVSDQVLQAGYAAGFLGGISIQNDLYASSAWTTIRDVFTFNANTIDLVSLGGSIVAQSGSSGGPVVNQDGVTVGVIVTNSGTGDTSSRNLHAITTSYIVQDFANERGKSLSQALSSDLASEVDIYNRVYFPSAKAALVAEIEK
jgi:S1-C subfamily serine protease